MVTTPEVRVDWDDLTGLTVSSGGEINLKTA